MMEIIIDRSYWRRGGESIYGQNKNKVGKGRTELCNLHGQMCCLGQWIKQTRPDINIQRRPDPRSTMLEIDLLTERIEDFFDEHLDEIVHTDFAKQMMKFNDDHTIDDQEREKQLTLIAHSVGVKLTFV